MGMDPRLLQGSMGDLPGYQHDPVHVSTVCFHRGGSTGKRATPCACKLLALGGDKVESKTIELTIKAQVEVPESHWSEIRDDMIERPSTDCLHESLCTWLWACMPLTLAGYDLTVQVTVK